LWGSLKDTTYKTNHTLEKLGNICHEIAISWAELQRINNVLHQYTYARKATFLASAVALVSFKLL